jgi:hypothetical protein
MCHLMYFKSVKVAPSPKFLENILKEAYFFFPMQIQRGRRKVFRLKECYDKGGKPFSFFFSFFFLIFIFESFVNVLLIWKERIHSIINTTYIRSFWEVFFIFIFESFVNVLLIWKERIHSIINTTYIRSFWEEWTTSKTFRHELVTRNYCILSYLLNELGKSAIEIKGYCWRYKLQADSLKHLTIWNITA